MSWWSSIETSSFYEKIANNFPSTTYYSWLFPEQRNILDLNFDKFIDDLIEVKWISGLFKADNQDKRISWQVIDGINIILPGKLPQKNEVTDHIVWIQYLNKAQQILKKLKKIELSDAYQQRKRVREASNLRFEWPWLSNIIREFEWYIKTITEHIKTLQSQEQAHQIIDEESKQYEWQIAQSIGS